MKSYIIVVSLVLFITSCKTKTDSIHRENDVVIYGSMNNGEGSQLFIRNIYNRSDEKVDTIEIDAKGFFSHQIQAEQDEFYSIINNEGSTITIYCSPKDSIKIEADYQDFSQYDLSGSHESIQISLLNDATRSFLNKIASLSKISNDSLSSPDYASIKMDIDAQYRNEFEKLKEFSTNFIGDNEGSLVSLLALSNQLGANFFVFHPSQDKELFYRIDSALYEIYSDYEPVERLHFQIKQLKAETKEGSSYKKGDRIPDFSLPDTNGVNQNLYSIQAEFILVDFWASWCKICRQENIKFLDVYTKYHSNGFEILQISLDESEVEWKNAIDEDALPWAQWSDLKYWDSKVVNLFNISSIPFNYLVDSNGVVLAKNLEAGELKKQLEILFEKKYTK